MTDNARRNIAEKKQEIKRLKEKIRQNYEKQTEQYFEMRKILEDETNHEDDLICRPLKKKYLRKYQELLQDYKSNYFEYKKENEDSKKKIEQHFNKINEYRKQILDIERANQNKENQKFEERRRNNLQSIIGFLKDKKQYEEYLARINNILNDKKTKK